MHTWSLAVEEHFYLILCVGLMILIGAKQLRKLPLVCVAICLLSLTLRYLSYAGTLSDPHIRFLTYLRMDALMFGVLLSYLHHFHRSTLQQIVCRRVASLLVLAGLLIMPSIVLEYGILRFTIGLTMLYVGFGIILMVCIYVPVTNRLTAVLAYIGFYSYSIYLWHMLFSFVVWTSFTLLHSTEWFIHLLMTSTYLSGSIGFGVAMSKVIEIPFLRLRDRLFPSSLASVRVQRRELRQPALLRRA